MVKTLYKSAFCYPEIIASIFYKKNRSSLATSNIV